MVTTWSGVGQRQGGLLVGTGQRLSTDQEHLPRTALKGATFPLCVIWRSESCSSFHRSHGTVELNSHKRQDKVSHGRKGSK